jgi:putative phosphoesterase
VETEGGTVKRVAAIYDIHGNLPALEVVLAEIERDAPDLILVGGDIAYGPMPHETVDAVMALGSRALVIRGNADRELVELRDAIDRGEEPADDGFGGVAIWCAKQLTHEQCEYLAGLPETVTLEIVGLGATLFCHGSPRSDEEIVTAITPEERLQPMFEAVTEAVVICGHTHVQFDRSAGGKRIVNPGSVGMPYADQLGAYWALIGPTVQLRRMDYDVEQTACLIGATAMPGAEEFVRENVLTYPSAEEATAHFEQMAEERELKAR